MRFLIPVLIFMILVFFLWKGLLTSSKSLPSPLIGKKTPVFELSVLKDPNQWVNQTILTGKVTILNVFASWCVICQEEHRFWMEASRKELGLLNRLKKTNKLIFLMGLNYHDVREDIDRRLVGMGDPYDLILFDEHGKFGMDLGVYGTPETFIIDQKGIVRYRHVGAVNEFVWENKLLPLIEDLQREI